MVAHPRSNPATSLNSRLGWARLYLAMPFNFLAWLFASIAMFIEPEDIDDLLDEDD